MAILTEQRQRFVAVGEIGIDLYWDKTYRAEQIAVFEKQCQAAVDLDLPIIIHCREGLDETLQVVSQFPTLRGVFHSFGGTADDVARIREIGDYYFGVNGIVTFKNSKLRDVLPTIGLNRILLETDSPYLAPVPYRGKRNESAYIVSTAHCVADALGVPYDVVAEQTSENARNLFGLNIL
jgi:TatD DNase family protein